jgi:hypothetical protein
LQASANGLQLLPIGSNRGDLLFVCDFFWNSGMLIENRLPTVTDVIFNNLLVDSFCCAAPATLALNQAAIHTAATFACLWRA